MDEVSDIRQCLERALPVLAGDDEVHLASTASGPDLVSIDEEGCVRVLIHVLRRGADGEIADMSEFSIALLPAPVRPLGAPGRRRRYLEGWAAALPALLELARCEGIAPILVMGEMDLLRDATLDSVDDFRAAFVAAATGEPTSLNPGGMPTPEAVRRRFIAGAALDLVAFVGGEVDRNGIIWLADQGRGLYHELPGDDEGNSLRALFANGDVLVKGYGWGVGARPLDATVRAAIETVWPGALGPRDDVTFCLMHRAVDPVWRSFGASEGQCDGSRATLRFLTWDAAEHAAWLAEWAASPHGPRRVALPDIAAVAEVLTGQPVTAAQVRRLRPDLDAAGVERTLRLLASWALPIGTGSDDAYE